MWIWIAVSLLAVCVGLLLLACQDRFESVEKEQRRESSDRLTAHARLSAELAATKARLTELQESHQALAIDTARRNLQAVVAPVRRRSKKA